MVTLLPDWLCAPTTDARAVRARARRHAQARLEVCSCMSCPADECGMGCSCQALFESTSALTVTAGTEWHVFRDNPCKSARWRLAVADGVLTACAINGRAPSATRFGAANRANGFGLASSCDGAAQERTARHANWADGARRSLVGARFTAHRPPGCSACSTAGLRCGGTLNGKKLDAGRPRWRRFLSAFGTSWSGGDSG